jgi:hypothetical protein
MPNLAPLKIDAKVMAPIGDVLYPGVVARPPDGHPLDKGMVCVRLTPPLQVEGPLTSIDFVTCPVGRVIYAAPLIVQRLNPLCGIGLVRVFAV